MIKFPFAHRTSPAAMPHPYHRCNRGPEPARRRALELLAASADGATEAIMLAHGFTVEMLVELIRAGALCGEQGMPPILKPQTGRGATW